MSNGLAIGPMKPDDAGELTANAGTHNHAHRLIQKHAQMYPKALTNALARPTDDGRTAALQDHLDLVEDNLLALEGRRAFFKEGYTLLGASVRGRTDRDRCVAVLFETDETGRSVRGVIPYEGFEEVERDYEDRVAAEAGILARMRGETPPPAAADDSAVNERLEKLEAAAQEAEARAKAAEEKVAALEADAAIDPEPFEGYDALNEAQLRDRFASDGAVYYGANGIAQMLEYEERNKNRKGVKDAITDLDGQLPTGS